MLDGAYYDYDWCYKKPINNFIDRKSKPKWLLEAPLNITMMNYNSIVLDTR